MYVGTIGGEDIRFNKQIVFDSVSELVEYYNKNHKGDHQVDIHEAIEDSTGCVYQGEYMFSFHTENYGDIR